MDTPLAAALDYAARGWAVFPCHGPRPGGCTCRDGSACPSIAKHPRTRHGLRDASTDAATLHAWWQAWPSANVGVRTGGGLVVVDLDPGHGATSALAELEAAHGALPPTLAVRTGGGGMHLYFAADRPVRNSAGALGPGIDVRGDGGFVIAPPSRHASGAPYRWSAPAPLARLPGWVAHRLVREPARPGGEPAAPRLDPSVSAWATRAVAGEVDRVTGAPAGQRNHSLNRAAFVLGQIVAGGHLDRAEVVELLGQAATSAGLGPGEIAATLDSGLDAGERWPRHPPPRPLARGATHAVDLTSVDLPSPAAPSRRDAGIEQAMTP